jgi:hypothetical protein
MKTWKYLIFVMGLCLVLSGCKKDPVVEQTPLEEAIESFGDAASYRLDIDFISAEESDQAVVKMAERAAYVEALDEVVYYEVEGDTCYVYGYEASSWNREETTCSEKGTAELMFLTEFSANYFVENVVDGKTIYRLKVEYYDRLGSFMGGSNTRNFTMTLEENRIETIAFAMTRDEIDFEIVIHVSGINETTVNLPNV